MYKYSAQEKGFYTEEIHGENMPSDVVDVSKEEHEYLMTGQAKGMVIEPNSNGHPVLVDPAQPSTEDKKLLCKNMAKQFLVETDWSQYSDVSETLLNKEEFDIYRAVIRGLLLRPIPDPVWPKQPEAVWKE